MELEDALRKRIRALKRLGVSQWAIGKRMGYKSAPTFSKWLNEKPGIGDVSLAASEKFERYAAELARTALGLSGATELTDAALRVRPQFEALALEALHRWGAPREASGASRADRANPPRVAGRRDRAPSGE